MISLVPTGQFGETPAATTTPAAAQEPMAKIRVQAISMRDALVLGVVSGFALAAGNLIFSKLAKWRRWT